MTQLPILTHEDTLSILNFATRLLSLDLSAEMIYERALESLSDFSANGKVALYTLGEDENILHLEATFVDLKYRSRKEDIPIPGTPMHEVMREKRYGCYPVAVNAGFPLPTNVVHPEGRECLCLPLVGSNANVIGMVALELASDQNCRIDDIQILIILTTVTAISIENARLFKLATHDGLTGLYVRNFFDIRLQEELARVHRYGGVLTLMLTDIDNFKAVNDRYGHRQGDDVLRELAAIFRSHLRGGIDLVCRYGGDEFLTLMTATSREDALQVATRIHQACASHVFPDGAQGFHVTISSGIATLASPALSTGRELLERADAVLYRAKGGGKNQICTWEP